MAKQVLLKMFPFSGARALAKPGAPTLLLHNHSGKTYRDRPTETNQAWHAVVADSHTSFADPPFVCQLAIRPK